MPTDQFLGEITMGGYLFAPRGWALCNGQLLAIAQNTALFSLLGTSYGGDGRTTFGLPNLQGRAPMHRGQGPGLTPRQVGETSGSETVTLLLSEMAAHNHLIGASIGSADLSAPGPTRIIAKSGGGFAFQSNTTQNVVAMSAQALATAGGSQPHNNMQPYLVVNFCIALTGIFPARN
jgi:microcystin-dependent protein